jgi:hypothetical protein
MGAGGRLSADGCLRNPATRDPSVYGTQRAAPSLERHHRAVCVGCMPHGWLASTRASTMGAQRALPRQARTERRASWVRSMHRVVPRGFVRVRLSGGLLAARCRLERSQRVLDVRSAKWRHRIALAHGIPVDPPPELCHILRRSKVDVKNLKKPVLSDPIPSPLLKTRTLRSPGQTPHSPLV